jgi:type II secretion system protein N
MFRPRTVLSSNGGVGSHSRRGVLGRFGMHLSALLLFILFFTGSVLLFFPKAQLRDQIVGLILRQTGQHIEIGGLSFSPLLGVEATGIAWQPDDKKWPPVTVDRLFLSPQWTSLFGSNPAGGFHASVAEGEIDGWCGRDGSFNATLADVNLAPFITAGFLFPPTGRIGGTMALDRQTGPGMGTAGFDLVVEDLRVSGMNTIGLKENELSLGRLLLRGKMIDRTLNLEELQNEGGDLSLSCHGTILISQKPQLSRLNLQIALRPGTGMKKTLGDLLLLTGLKAEPDGGYNFRLAGTLARPILR